MSGRSPPEVNREKAREGVRARGLWGVAIFVLVPPDGDDGYPSWRRPFGKRNSFVYNMEEDRLLLVRVPPQQLGAA